MTKDKKLTEVELIACEICLKEVPLDDSTSPETEDYVAHFCGLECYEQWKAQDVKADEQDKKSGS